MRSNECVRGGPPPGWISMCCEDHIVSGCVSLSVGVCLYDFVCVSFSFWSSGGVTVSLTVWLVTYLLPLAIQLMSLPPFLFHLCTPFPGGFVRSARPCLCPVASPACKQAACVTPCSEPWLRPLYPRRPVCVIWRCGGLASPLLLSPAPSFSPSEPFSELSSPSFMRHACNCVRAPCSRPSCGLTAAE